VREAKQPFRRYRALFLGATGPTPALVAHAWLAAGHEILEFWTVDASGPSDWRRDRHTGICTPQWSVSAAIRRGRIAPHVLPAAADWQQAAARAAALRPDLVLSVHFPRLLPRSFLDSLAMPVLNLHPALLPRFRGPYPLMAMLLDGTADRYGGVTLHAITAGMDKGPIIAAVPVPLESGGEVRRWELSLAEAAAALVVQVVPRYLRGEIGAVPQDEAVATLARPTTAAFRLTPAETADRVAWLCGTVGQLRQLVMRIAGRDYRIMDLVQRLGPTTGAPPRIGWRRIELDLADARVRLRRRLPGDGKRRRIAQFYRRLTTRPLIAR